ncbi:MAG: response regulator [Chloroflexota bacterium]
MSLILVADDAAFQRLRVRKVCENAGHEVVEASSGREAVDMFVASHPDAVLMDITMPDMDGLEALGRIRELDPTARVVMLSALAQQAVVIKAVMAGARDFIAKPAEADRVLSALNRALA